MASVVADTHTVIWYVDAPAELSKRATTSLDTAATTTGEYIYISAITLIEIRYLVERGRVDAAVLATIEQELDAPVPRIIVHAIDQNLARTLAAISRSVVPEMPDRIIAATALFLSLPLVSRDSKMRQLNNVTVIW